MKPLPDLTDEAAMLSRGKRSVLTSARNEAAEALRDACTAVQSADISQLRERARVVKEIAQRLLEIVDLWETI